MKKQANKCAFSKNHKIQNINEVCQESERQAELHASTQDEAWPCVGRQINHWTTREVSEAFFEANSELCSASWCSPDGPSGEKVDAEVMAEEQGFPTQSVSVVLLV